MCCAIMCVLSLFFSCEAVLLLTLLNLTQLVTAVNPVERDRIMWVNIKRVYFFYFLCHLSVTTALTFFIKPHLAFAVNG